MMQNYDGQFELNGQEYLFRAKYDSGSSKITRVNHEEHHYRIVEIVNRETKKSDGIMINTGDSFTVFPDMELSGSLSDHGKRSSKKLRSVSSMCLGISVSKY